MKPLPGCSSATHRLASEPGLTYRRLRYSAGLLAIALLGSVPAAGETESIITRWGEAVDIDSRVVTEIGRFEEDRGPFGDGYAAELAIGIHRLVVASAAGVSRKVRDGVCEPFTEVTFPAAGFVTGVPPSGRSEREFEESFVRTEALACFQTDVTPREALGIYTSADFRKQVSKRLEEVRAEDGHDCVKVRGVSFVLGPMDYCSRVEELHEKGLSLQYSQVVSNGGDEDTQPVYFKESLKVFIAVPGGLAFYYINYSRSTDMGGLKKRIGRGKLVESQEKAIRHLEAQITSPPAGTERSD